MKARLLEFENLRRNQARCLLLRDPSTGRKISTRSTAESSRSRLLRSSSKRRLTRKERGERPPFVGFSSISVHVAPGIVLPANILSPIPPSQLKWEEQRREGYRKRKTLEPWAKRAATALFPLRSSRCCKRDNQVILVSLVRSLVRSFARSLLKTARMFRAVRTSSSKRQIHRQRRTRNRVIVRGADQ